MSTNNHTAITTGAAANASTINNPLGQLDAAIDTLDTRVDTIIAGSGTSSTEVVDSRGGYTVLSKRVDDLWLTENLVCLVDPNFNGLNAANRYKTIQGAMDLGPGAGMTIIIAPGTYTEEITVTYNNITLIGAGQPYYDGTDLSGGTIIKGRINGNGKIGLRVKNLGVDIRASANDDAINANAAATGTGAFRGQFENLTLLGKGSAVTADRGHGILMAFGGENQVRNCKFFLWYHGVALRSSGNTVSDCYFYNCLSDSVIVKGDTGSGSALNNAITNCIIDGSDSSGYARGGPIRVQNVHANTSCQFTTISNITAKNCDEGAILIQQTAGICSRVMVANVVSYNNGSAAIRADFDVDSATDVHFANCMSADRSDGYGFRVKGTAARVRAMNCSSDATGAGRYVQEDTGVFDYLDLGSGLGTDLARFRNLTFDLSLTTESMVMRNAQIMIGAATVSSGATEEFLRLTWAGAPNSAVVAVDLTLISTAGAHATIYARRAIIIRPNSTTLTGAIETIGTDMVDAGGAQGSITVALDLATANVAKFTATANSYAQAFAYRAEILSMMTGAWRIQNYGA